MKKKYIIFDFDGTLCNTNDIIVDSWQATAEHFFGQRFDRHLLELAFGETLVNMTNTFFPGLPRDEVIDYYRNHQEANQKGKVYVFEGVRELMDILRSRGYKIGVATSRTAYSFWNYMKQFGIDTDVDEVVTIDDVKKHKPDKESITAVLEKLTGYPKDELPASVLEESIMIGDTKFDAGCANNAGVDSVLVRWSHDIDEEDLASTGFVPTYWIDKPEDLLELI